MVPHIGEIIHALVEQRKIPTAKMQEIIERGEQAVFRMYREEAINSDRLLKLSVFFGENLFLRFQEHELLKDLPNPQIIQLQGAIAEAKDIIAQTENIVAERDKRIRELDYILSLLKEEIQRLKKSQADASSESAR
jgi:uncharacterized coiled-coil protein SlyX